MGQCTFLLLLIFLYWIPLETFTGGEIERLVKPIQSVGREGAGNVEASRAWSELGRKGPEALPGILHGFKGADATAANWLRAAVDAIAERALVENRPLPVKELEVFIRDQANAPRARRLAYEWLVRVDTSGPRRLLPGMLQDPSAELRRDAVAVVVEEAQKELEQGDKTAATATYFKALSGATDKDQVELTVEQLQSLGVEVDLAGHFGFIRNWNLLGPFDNTGGTGFDTPYPPEKEIDLEASYLGKGGQSISWKQYSTSDRYGLVDLYGPLGKHSGVVAYALALVDSPEEQLVEIRAGSNNAIRIFVNGQEVFSGEEYHHGIKMDQHVGRGVLQPGQNAVLVKVCQNEQTEDWAQNWSFQLRICNEVGEAVVMTTE